MNHKQWQELVPFYVAQTLDYEAKQAFEQHLAQCGGRCQQELNEWRVIAPAVWEEADFIARDKPPLSQEVYNRLLYPDSRPTGYAANPQRPSYTSPDEIRERRSGQGRGFYVPVTLVAGFIVAISLVRY